MNVNERAITYLEKNQFDFARQTFKEAVVESRDVQSLHNLAWFFAYEEDDFLSAITLLEEVMEMHPVSHFPFNLLGELYCRQENWSAAVSVLQKGISIQPTKEAYNNLGVAFYHLKNFQEAAINFLAAAEPSDYALYSHIWCLILVGDDVEAKRKLVVFTEQDAEFVGTVEVADLYVMLGCYEEAIDWFDKGMTEYWKQPNWIARYLFSLLQMNEETKADAILQIALSEKKEEMQEAAAEACDEHWTELDKQRHLKELLQEQVEYEQLLRKLKNGFVPKLEFEPTLQTACTLFGCTQHQHPEYQ